jgi:hypothetical protein
VSCPTGLRRHNAWLLASGEGKVNASGDDHPAHGGRNSPIWGTNNQLIIIVKGGEGRRRRDCVSEDAALDELSEPDSLYFAQCNLVLCRVI